VKQSILNLSWPSQILIRFTSELCIIKIINRLINQNSLFAKQIKICRRRKNTSKNKNCSAQETANVQGTK